jgi:hypothetical protein
VSAAEEAASTGSHSASRTSSPAAAPASTSSTAGAAASAAPENPYALEAVPKELIFLPRSILLKRGFRAIGEGNAKEAHTYFGAAIRKARRHNLWDVEAEFFKFVTLYIHGEYAQAVNRCLVCLDGVRSLWEMAIAGDARLPASPLMERLEECLTQTMVMRRDSFWKLVQHFNHIHTGEYYMGKRAVGLPLSLTRAWRTTSCHVKISYELLKAELEPFTAFYIERYTALASEAERQEEERLRDILEEEERAKTPAAPETAAPKAP